MFPDVPTLTKELLAIFAECDALFVDGTFWRDDEMAACGISAKRASEMGHLPLSGTDGLIQVLSALPRRRRILIHINNTNPILDEQSAEAGEVTAAGLEVAHDGMDITV